jgi:hypothetical protein
MNKWFSNFEVEARAICQRYNVLDLWEKGTKILKDDKENKIAIVSMGTYIKGSNTHLAIEEILKAFNSN